MTKLTIIYLKKAKMIIWVPVCMHVYVCLFLFLKCQKKKKKRNTELLARQFNSWKRISFFSWSHLPLMPLSFTTVNLIQQPPHRSSGLEVAQPTGALLALCCKAALLALCPACFLPRPQQSFSPASQYLTCIIIVNSFFQNAGGICTHPGWISWCSGWPIPPAFPGTSEWQLCHQAYWLLSSF